MGLHKTSAKTVTAMLVKKIGHFNISSENQGGMKAVLDQMQKRLVQREERAVGGARGKLVGFAVTGGELFHYIQQNKELSKNFCKGLYERLLDPIREHVDSSPPDFDFDKLTRELADAREQYEKQARGPEKWAVLQEMDKSAEKLQAQIDKMGYQRKLMQEQQRAHEAELRVKEMKREIQSLRQQVQDMQQTQQETLQEMVEQYEIQIEKMKQEMEERHAAALQRIEDFQNAKRAEQARMARVRLDIERAITSEKIGKMQEKQAEFRRHLEELLAPPPKTGWKWCTIS